MNRTWNFIVGALVIVLVAACGVLLVRWHETSNTLASVRTQDEDTRDRYSEAIGSIATIQDSLNAIVMGDEASRLGTGSLAAERGLTRTESDQVMDRISQLRAGVERSKARIQELDDRLKKGGIRMAGLEKMLASLKRNVVAKEQMIAQLQSRVDSLGTQVTDLTASNEEKTHELGTVYVMMGNRKELTQSGVVIAKGGVLGLGKTLKPSGTLDETRCTMIDTDTETTIDIPSKKALVVTGQPVASYQLEPAGDHTVLRILDPKEFRKVRQLVIVEQA